MGNIDGISRDQNGIVTARRDRHPLAHLFDALPSGLDGTHFYPPPEIGHLAAIHMFDNLHCSPPNNPVYKLRLPKNAQQQGAAGIWVPINEPDEVTEDHPAAAEIEDMTEEVEAWDEPKLQAMKLAIRAAEIKKKRAAQADPVPDPVPLVIPEPTQVDQDPGQIQ